MTTLGQPSHKGPLSRCCPECGGGSIRPYIRAKTARCQNCQYYGRLREFTPIHAAPEPVKPKASGSGVIAQPRQPVEWRELRRDPYEHMRLAMRTRN